MGREIKFRAWDYCHIRQQNIMRMVSGESALYIIDNARFPKRIIMQYTGLKDKHGKEIYEGDVVWYNVKLLSVRFGAYIEAWGGICPKDGHNAHGWYMCDEEEKNIKSLLTAWSIPEMQDIEIIGNLYEHPELLK